MRRRDSKRQQSRLSTSTRTMRFTRAFALLPLLAPAFVSGQILDVCAAVNVDLFALLGLANLGGLVNVCLCLSALPRKLSRSREGVMFSSRLAQSSSRQTRSQSLPLTSSAPTQLLTPSQISYVVLHDRRATADFLSSSAPRATSNAPSRPTAPLCAPQPTHAVSTSVFRPVHIVSSS